MRNVASFALTTSSLFILLAAVMLNSTALFLMGTALFVMILMCRLQAWLAVRGLQMTRQCPDVVNLGELVTVQIGVISDFGFKRPLVTVVDNLPEEMNVSDLSPSLPIAPAHETPIQTQYQFQANCRGKFRWNSLSVQSSDALGLVRMSRKYTTSPTVLQVLPIPIPFEVQLPYAAGWGFSESDYGRSRGQGIEPRGIREYTDGDSQRYIHWRSSARSTQLMVKEFETGALARAHIFIQRTAASVKRSSDRQILDRMCGNAAYLAETLIVHGAEICMPSLAGDRLGTNETNKIHEILRLLSEVEYDQLETLGSEVERYANQIQSGSTIYLFVSHVDPTLARSIHSLTTKGIKAIAILYRVGNESFVAELQKAGACIQFEVTR